MVLRPIENMLSLVDAISSDPTGQGLADVSSRDNTGAYETKVRVHGWRRYLPLKSL